MAEETKTETAAAEAPVKAAETVAKTASDSVKASAKVAEKAAKPARRVKRAKAARPAAKRRVAAKRAATTRKINRATTAAERVANKGIETMTNNVFAFDAIPAFAPFQSAMDQANERSQDLIKKSQKVAEEMADLTRANVEALVEAGKIAVEGTKSIGQDFVAKGRDGVEQASDAIRSLAEAKSPTEYMQLQGEFARAQFDRFVADSSKLTETMVKLAGEAFQPLQNRAAANAQRFNTLVA